MSQKGVRGAQIADGKKKNSGFFAPSTRLTPLIVCVLHFGPEEAPKGGPYERKILFLGKHFREKGIFRLPFSVILVTARWHKLGTRTTG